MHDRKTASIIFGLIIIIFGGTLLMHSLGIIKGRYDIGPWWPALFIFAGMLVGDTRNTAIPFGMVSVGALLLARNLGLFASDSVVGSLLILLCALGVLAIAVAPRKKKH